jgi:hypothetical protein
MADFDLPYRSGVTVYALIFDEDWAWGGSAFVDPSGSWTACAVAMTYDAGEGKYLGSFPAELPSGTYTVAAFLQLGAEPAASDPEIGLAYVFWPGSATVPPLGGFRSALVSRLNADATLATLVGDRVFPQVRPQRSALPAVVVSIVSIDRDHDLDGPTGLGLAEVELRAHSLDFTDCDRIANYLRTLFDGFEGILANGVEVLETLSLDESDDYDDAAEGSDDGTFQIPVEYSFRFRESTPNRS